VGVGVGVGVGVWGWGWGWGCGCGRVCVLALGYIRGFPAFVIELYKADHNEVFNGMLIKVC